LKNAHSWNAHSENAHSENAHSGNDSPWKKIPRRMNFRNVKMEIVIPLFTGLLGSFLLCAVVAADTAIFSKDYAAIRIRGNVEEDKEDSKFFLSVTERGPDPIMEYYRRSEYKKWVIDFFTDICSSREIAQAILHNANEFNVPAALAFALSWEESRFNPRAVSRPNRDGSVDRGLFQLNNRSFPDLDTLSFFNIQYNARYGVSYLRYCLDFGGSEVSALAMYNAGTGRVKSTGAPSVTLNYISRILENKSKIESRFHTMLIKEEEKKYAENSSQLQFNPTLRITSP
jgi:Soluble lytic murein transglycosylase and related regulatory proteins (some contain LysM/invasin domains)